jgi:hypothetical protein
MEDEDQKEGSNSTEEKPLAPDAARQLLTSLRVHPLYRTAS